MMEPIRRLYDELLRPRIPHKISVHNGIPVRGVVRLFDRTDEFPEYEDALLHEIRDAVRYGDDVTIVGGGLGVSTVVAAQRSVVEDSVVTFEGSADQFDVIQETTRLNRLTEQCRVNHAIVGKNVGVYGDPDGADRVPPADLPESDVLVLDCEGTEIQIIESMTTAPDTVVVETHEFLDAPESDVREALIARGYEVISRREEDPDKGVFILRAVK